ncbi:MAG: response regulator [Myxococcales bacterium]|nr:response regulator [Myxococcales bacterium]
MGDSRRLLVVDDEAGVRSSLRRVLEADGYDVVEAGDGATALTMLQEQAFQVVISDQMMPGLSGVDFLKLVRVRHPQVVRIMLTGDRDPETTLRSINESEVYRFIRKPWNNRDLRTIVHFAFEVARLQEENQQLIELGRKQRDVRKKLVSETDPADIESELLLLAAEEAELLD